MQRPIDIADIDIVIFHAKCQDGITASHIFKHKCNEINKSLKLMPSGHKGEEVKMDTIKGKNIIMVDIVTDNIEEIKKNANKLYVLDHHKTAVDKYSDLEYCYFDMFKCGTTLAYEYVYENQEIPKFIKCIESRDLWTWEAENSKEFTTGYYEKSLTEDLFELFKILTEENDHKLFNEIIEFGKELIIKKDEQINKYFSTVKIKHIKIKKITEFNKHKDAILDVMFDNIKIDDNSYCKNEKNEDIIYKIVKIEANDELYALRSDFGNYCMLNLDIDFIVIYKFNEDTSEYFCSLRSTKEKVDLVKNKIAKGHPCAAGLTLNYHPDEHFINVE